MLDGLARQVRSVLEAAPDAPPLHDLLILVDDVVIECSSSSEPEVFLLHLEEDLQQVHHDIVDHSSLFHTEVFLAVLYRLATVLPPTSIISWFDIVLRPALREPKLPTAVVNHAKELIICALKKTEEVYVKKVGEFRRRLLDLFLLDAYNEGSGDDVLEWAELDEEQKEKRSHWKCNLEDILIKFGLEQPQDLMTELYIHFENPTSRLQLLMLLNKYASEPSFESSSAVLASHPLMLSIIHSLCLDTSSTVCTSGLTLLVKLLPMFAVYARSDLKVLFPRYLAVLARVMVWKERSQSIELEMPGPSNPESPRNLGSNLLPIRPDCKWNRLETTFRATPSPPPCARSYFTILYYLYPSNVLQFLSRPAEYLAHFSVPTPFLLDWEEVLDQDEIRRKSERLVREHVCHPLLLRRDATTELSADEFWTRYSVSRITTEANMLDIQRSALGLLEQLRSSTPPQQQPDEHVGEQEQPTHLIHPINLSTEETTISLEDMVNTTMALRSNINVHIVKPVSQWASGLFSYSSSSGEQPFRLPSGSGEIPSHFVQVISSLQRENVLLRNELNFELWLSRENVKHIGRLYQDRIQAKAAEAERQGLYNKLRNYRTQVIRLEKELDEHKEQASSAKNKYADWNRELQKRSKELKEEKKTWISEAARLRAAESQAQSRLAAQKKDLADALSQVFELQTQKKEIQPKIDRLRDYERQIDQHIKMQRLWDDDFAKFNQRAEEIGLMRNQYQEMKLQLESFERTQAEMDDAARVYRRRIQTLEAQLSQAQSSHHQEKQQRHYASAEISAFTAGKMALLEANKRLKTENIELKDDLEYYKAMVEILKGQHTGRQGLVSEPRASPVQFM